MNFTEFTEYKKPGDIEASNTNNFPVKWHPLLQYYVSNFSFREGVLMQLKCIWHKIFLLLIWKAFWNTEEWRFPFWNIFFLFQRYWHFSIMQIRSVMTLSGLQLKMVKYSITGAHHGDGLLSINNISKTIEAAVLGTWHHKLYHKRNKWHPWSCYHDNSFAAGAVSVKTLIPSFCLKPAPFTAANSVIGIKTIWVLCILVISTKLKM